MTYPNRIPPNPAKAAKANVKNLFPEPEKPLPAETGPPAIVVEVSVVEVSVVEVSVVEVSRVLIKSLSKFASEGCDRLRVGLGYRRFSVEKEGERYTMHRCPNQLIIYAMQRVNVQIWRVTSTEGPLSPPRVGSLTDC
jgi:hypothetical protein